MSDLAIEEFDCVSVLEVKRPPHNYFDTELIRDIADGLQVAVAKGARAAIICSEGKSFCAGADLTGSDQLSGGRTVYDEAVRIFDQSIPIVAAVQGGAIGGGLGLAMAADFRVASSDSYFWANFARLGFHHGFGLTVTLPRAVGNQRAEEMLYGAQKVGAVKALEIGLCDRLVSEQLLREEAIAFAQEIAGNAPLAVQSIRSTMRSELAIRVRGAIARELSEQRSLMKTSDFKEGIRASKQRRQPNFEGR